MHIVSAYKSILDKKIGLIGFFSLFNNEAECLDLYFHLRFSGKKCAKCDRLIVDNYKRINTRKAYRCRSCGTYIYPLSNTLFEKTTVPLSSIFLTWFFLCNGRVLSATEMSSDLGISYKTAHRLMLRNRMLLYDNATHKMKGTIEVDEAFMAKGNKFNNWGGVGTRKQPIIGMIERGTKYLRLFLVPNRNQNTIHKLIRKNVEEGSTVYTDSWRGYNGLCEFYNHETIDHKAHEFVRGDVHTNSIENVWRHFKRNIRRSNVSISDKYVHLYLDETAWRHNSRGFKAMFLFNQLLVRSTLTFDFHPL